MLLLRILIIIFIIFLSGCATITNFDSVPISTADFDKPLPEIRKEFSDVSLYENYWRGFPTKFGNPVALEKKWGAPDKVETKWGEKAVNIILGAAIFAYAGLPVAAFVAVEAIFIYPRQSYHWTKGDIHVDATISRPGLEGYERRLTYWRWEKTHNETKISNCLANC